MAIIMTSDGQVRPLQPADLKDIAERDTRIRQLEQLNATLAAQVDRMRPVVTAAWGWRLSEGAPVRAVVLSEAVDAYQSAMAQLAKER
jgi:hypothetical protein